MKQVYILSFVSLLLWLIYCSWSNYVAHLHYYNVKNSFDFWRKHPEQLRLNDVEQNFISINSALSLVPDNSVYYQTRGQLYEWLAVLDSENREGILKRAIQDYQTSLEYRPLWAPTWINLASVKWRLGEIDEEFKGYLSNAIDVGSNQASVHKFIVKFGLTHYKAKTPGYILVYEQLPKHLALGLINPLSEREIVMTVDMLQLHGFACRLLKNEASNVRKKIRNCR